MGNHESRQAVGACRRFARGESYFGNDISMTPYFAAPACDDLPPEVRRDDWVIQHGYAVGFADRGPRGFNRWFFFTDLAPAVAFSRAARMSQDTATYAGTHQAAHELVYCDHHRTDEHLLLIRPASSSGQDHPDHDELQLEQLTRFVQICREAPSHVRTR